MIKIAFYILLICCILWGTYSTYGYKPFSKRL